MKKIIALGVCFFILSCKSIQNERYSILNSFLDQEYSSLKKDSFSKPNDTIFIMENASVKYISDYTYYWDFDKNSKTRSMYTVHWIDSTKTILLNQENMAFMREQLETLNPDLWNKKKISSPNRIVVSKNDVFNKNGKYNEFILKKRLAVYNFSMPIFNINKDVAVFELYKNGNSSTSSYSKPCLIIMRKENKKWIYVGSSSNTSSH